MHTEKRLEELNRMMWMGLVVVLIVPAAFVMICGYVLLQSWGVPHAVKHFGKYGRRLLISLTHGRRP